MPSTTIQIADAVVSELNGHTFSQSFRAVRAYLPEYELGVTGLPLYAARGQVTCFSHLC